MCRPAFRQLLWVPWPGLRLGEGQDRAKVPVPNQGIEGRDIGWGELHVNHLGWRRLWWYRGCVWPIQTFANYQEVIEELLLVCMPHVVGCDRIDIGRPRFNRAGCAQRASVPGNVSQLLLRVQWVS